MYATENKDYLSCAETAKFVRGALKEAFPDVKFSVRSSNYSGGASIDVRWTDGPCRKRVEAVAQLFEGAGFDGMIDLKHYYSHYITPEGKVGVAHGSGTTGSAGTVPPTENPVPEGSRIVRFGADFIFCQREISDFEAKKEEALTWMRGHCSCDGEPPHDRFGNQWVDSIAQDMVYRREEGQTLEEVFDERW